MGKQNKQSNQQIAMAKKPEIDEKERRLNELKALLNSEITPRPGKSNVAVVIESRRTESGISPKNTLYNLLKTEKVNIIFSKKNHLKQKGSLEKFMMGI